MCSAVDGRSFLRRNGHGLRPPAGSLLAAKRGSFPLKLPHPPQNPRGVGRVKMDILCNM